MKRPFAEDPKEDKAENEVKEIPEIREQVEPSPIMKAANEFIQEHPELLKRLAD